MKILLIMGISIISLVVIYYIFTSNFVDVIWCKLTGKTPKSIQRDIASAKKLAVDQNKNIENIKRSLEKDQKILNDITQE